MVADFVGAGWSFPFGIEPNGAFTLANGTRKLEQSMRLILATYPGERPMRPSFGSRLRDYVFCAPSDEVTAELSQEVHAALLRWEPRVDVESVRVRPDPDRDGVLHIDIGYTVKATNDRHNLVFPFYTRPDSEVY